MYGKPARVEAPKVRFGRYTDAYKTAANYQAWDQALAAFETENFLEAFRFLLLYLRDETEDNVHFEETPDGIEFALYQGSKKIKGLASATKVKVQASIARAPNPQDSLMQRLLEKNFTLEYARFALDASHNIVILFDSYALDGAPYKLYHAIREVALNADKQDDLLLEEFGRLKATETGHLEPIPPAEQEAKYHYITNSLRSVLQEAAQGKPDFEQYPGAYVYLMLELVYKLDYLTRPEGYLMEQLERTHREYFAQDEKTTLEKVQTLSKTLQMLLDRPKAAYFREMYRGKSTFGITPAVNHDYVVASIDNEIDYMDWYVQQGYEHIALAIPGFIVGYCLFNYAVPKPDRDLFELYYQIMEQDFFQQTGFQLDYYDASTGRLQSRNIKKAIKHICKLHLEQYPQLQPNLHGLQFTSCWAFAKSYLLMIRNMDMTPVR